MGIFLMFITSCSKDNNQDSTTQVPVLTTEELSNITQTTATGGGNITSDGGTPVTASGVCWSISQTPTIADSKTNDDSDAGSFTSYITGLTAKTNYYVRAYATNSIGTGYGNVLSFTTQQDGESINITTVQIPAGTFTMGSPTSEVNHDAITEIQYQVTLSAFKMSKYEITNTQFAIFLNAKNIGSNGLYAAGAYPTQPLIYASSGSHDWGLHYLGGQWKPVEGYESHPIIYVTWFGATEFATYAGGQLPTEAEWEYACRATTTTPFNTGYCLSDTQANYSWGYPYSTCTNTNTTRPGKTQAVGTYSANSYGLHDMHGNVSEWCSDWYGAYPTTPQTNPTGVNTGSDRVSRDGTFYEYAQHCRSAYRGYLIPTSAGYGQGFRVVLAL